MFFLFSIQKLVSRLSHVFTEGRVDVWRRRPEFGLPRFLYDTAPGTNMCSLYIICKITPRGQKSSVAVTFPMWITVGPGKNQNPENFIARAHIFHDVHAFVCHFRP